VRRADGNYHEALRLINQVEDNNQELFNQWMQVLYKNDISELVKWVEDIAQIGRENQKSFFRYGLEFLHECILMQQVGQQQSRLQEEEKRLATWLSQHMRIEDWQQMAESFDNSHYHIERNAHPKILYMNLSLRLMRMISRKKLSLSA
jgi:DNA polymerase-3 subunit delta'